MGKIVAFMYGLIGYVISLLTVVYAIGFVGNLVVPKSIDSGEQGALGTSLLINIVLLGIFAVQHSGMARRGFKTWWSKIVPEPLERSTYVLIASLVLILLYWQWRPMTSQVWALEMPAGRIVLEVLFWLGWALVILATFLSNPFFVFGLGQAYRYLRAQSQPESRLDPPWLFQYVRNPVALGFLIAFWATPDMTMGHLLFSVATTGYIFIGVFLQERDLSQRYGTEYVDYRRRVSMIIPMPPKK